MSTPAQGDGGDVRSNYSSSPSIVPFALYSAYEIARHSWERPAVAVSRVVPVAAIVLLLPSIVHIPIL